MKTHFKVSKTNFILFSILCTGIVTGLISSFDQGKYNWRNILANLSTELIGAVILYYILEKIINQNEAKEKEKIELINQMDNLNNLTALDAIKKLYKKGWLQDGSVKGWYFNGADFQNADFQRANLSNVGFYRCNLTNAKINDKQFFKLNDLRFSTMPDGNIYNGKFRLKGDLDWAAQKYQINVSTADSVVLANYYGIDNDEYLLGQSWADENLVLLDTA